LQHRERIGRPADKREPPVVLPFAKNHWSVAGGNDMASSGRFIIVPDAVYQSSKLTPSAKLVYGVMLSLSKREGFCFASHKRIADTLQISRDTVLTAIRQLRDFRCISPLPEAGLKRGGYKGGVTECWQCLHLPVKRKPKLVSMPKQASAM
jgi:hypothetical protein